MFEINPQSFGLDISEKSVRIIKLKKKKGDLELASFGKTKIPTGVIKKGKIKDKEKLVNIIKKALKEINGEKIRTKYVISSLSEQSSFLDILKIPILDETEIKEA
ncbi:MAG: pilus assembly protein PilM, partial [Acidobacteriota bacterium]|nr:pilus assembly protein PilM [Acidobacteriota bacterium]